jgi:hypothetical protein
MQFRLKVVPSERSVTARQKSSTEIVAIYRHDAIPVRPKKRITGQNLRIMPKTSVPFFKQNNNICRSGFRNPSDTVICIVLPKCIYAAVIYRDQLAFGGRWNKNLHLKYTRRSHDPVFPTKRDRVSSDEMLQYTSEQSRMANAPTRCFTPMKASYGPRLEFRWQPVLRNESIARSL